MYHLPTHLIRVVNGHFYTTQRKGYVTPTTILHNVYSHLRTNSYKSTGKLTNGFVFGWGTLTYGLTGVQYCFFVSYVPSLLVKGVGGGISRFISPFESSVWALYIKCTGSISFFSVVSFVTGFDSSAGTGCSSGSMVTV